MILALDLGTRTGYAYWFNNQITTGFKDMKTTRFDGGGMRYLMFESFLDTFLTFDPEKVVYEAVRRHKGTDAAHVYGGFYATLTKWCEKHSIPYLGVPVGTIKKFATGSGNASKQAMILSAQAQGRDITDDNEADAYWILRSQLELSKESMQ